MRKWRAPIVVALILFAGCQGHELIPHNYSEDAVQWGQPVNGLQVGMLRW